MLYKECESNSGAHNKNIPEERVVCSATVAPRSRNGGWPYYSFPASSSFAAPHYYILGYFCGIRSNSARSVPTFCCNTFKASRNIFFAIMSITSWTEAWKLKVPLVTETKRRCIYSAV